MSRKISLLFSLLAISVATIFLYAADVIKSEGPVSYTQLWHQADSLKLAGQPAAAMEKVAVIIGKASGEQNQPNLVKGLLYRESLRSSFAEDYLLKSIAEFEQYLPRLTSPAKQIINSALGDLYTGYYQANQYELLQRTKTNQQGDDPESWDAARVLSRAEECYRLSLSEGDLLKKILTVDYSLVLERDTFSRDPLPTLFDVLNHRVIDFFVSGVGSHVKAGPVVNLTDSVWMAPVTEFALMNPIGSDKPKGYLLERFREAIAFHLIDKDPTALIDIDLQRLAYVYNNLELPNRDSLYLGALQSLESRYRNFEGATRVTYQIALMLRDKGTSAFERDKIIADRFLTRSIEKARQAISLFPGSKGAQDCKLLVASIERPILSVSARSQVLPSKPFVIDISSANIDTLWFRLIKLSGKDMVQVQGSDDDSLISRLVKRAPLRSWYSRLANPHPLVEFKQTLKQEPLKQGAYLLVAAQDKDFTSLGKIVASTFIQATRLAWLKAPDDVKSPRIVVVDRLTGYPLSGVKATLRYRNYDRTTRKFMSEEKTMQASNGKGEVFIDDMSRNNGVYVSLSRKGDTCFSLQSEWFAFLQRNDLGIGQKTWIFTDRAVYRPGQQVWFKGIVMSGTPGDYKAEVNRKVEMVLYNTNNQVVEKITLLTNEFGSVSGSFILPVSGLPGSYRISTSSGGESFKVESYKRPEFAVLIDQPDAAIKPGDEAIVGGKAEAYSGYSVTGARVNYKVSRFEFSLFGRGWFPRNEEVVMQGETVTDAGGKFIIRFNTARDIDLTSQRVKDYNYTVDATVTDQAGESQKGSISLRVSSTNLFLITEVIPWINIANMKPIQVKTTTIDGNSVASTIDISLFRLLQPDSCYWPADENCQLFGPWETDNFNFIQWSPGEQVASIQLRYDADSLVNIKNYITRPGVYAIKMKAADDEGNKTEKTLTFTVFDPESSKLPLRTPDWVVPYIHGKKIGEQVRFLYGSSEKNARYLVQVLTSKGVVAEQWLEADREQKLFSYPITTDLGDWVQFHFVLVRNNYYFYHEYNLSITESDQLIVHLSTFRDKTEPGSREKWSVKVADGNGKSLEAEVLASMYDASLDDIIAKPWKMDTEGYKSTGGTWSSDAFNQGSVQTDYIDTISYYAVAEPIYTNLNWFGFEFFNYFGRVMEGGKGIRSMALTFDAESQVKMPLIRKNREGSNELKPKSEGTKTTPLLRTNLNETAFFYPFLKSNRQTGIAEFEFVVPDALTRWKFRALAHTPDGMNATAQEIITSSRDVMVIPALPRFVRTGDSLSLPFRVINMSDKVQKTTVRLKLIDVVTGEKPDWIRELQPINLEVAAGGNGVASWPVSFAYNPGLIRYEVTVDAGLHTDGQAGTLPVLTDRIRLINTRAFTLHGKENLKANMAQYIDTEALRPDDQVKITLEYASNPAWYVVNALPALKMPDQHCLTDILFRYYAASMGRLAVSTYPGIRSAMEAMANGQKAEPSPLGQNDDLKILGLEDTPWVEHEQNETINQRHLVDFYNENNLRQFESGAVDMLSDYQLANGGFVWFIGMPDSRYLTGQVVETIGRMVKMGAVSLNDNPKLAEMIGKAVGYLDDQLLDDYTKMLKNSNTKKPAPDDSQLHYLYARSYFFSSYPVAEKYRAAFRYYQEGVSLKGVAISPMMQAMTALALHRAGDKQNAEKIMASLSDKALTDKEGNLYWRREYGQRWYDAPLETQSIVIEAWNELKPGNQDVEKMKGWLLSRKRTEAWESKSATAGACYAFLLTGDRQAVKVNPVELRLNGKVIPQQDNDTRTGYFRKDMMIESEDIAKTTVDFQGLGEGVGWGGIYVQYYAPQEKVQAAGSGFKLKRELIRESDNHWVTVEPGQRLTQGDKLRVRINVKAERDMEFVTLRDLRAAGLEPAGVLSGYEWRDGAGYYKVIGDATVDFFFYQMQRGTYVFEYDVNVTRNGDYADGPATIQCQYAPAFSGRSEGRRLEL